MDLFTRIVCKNSDADKINSWKYFYWSLLLEKSQISPWYITKAAYPPEYILYAFTPWFFVKNKKNTIKLKKR